MKIIRSCGALTAAILLFSVLNVSALEKQTSYQYDERSVSIPAPESYRVSRVWYAQDAGGQALSGPTDLFAAGDGTLYIADTNHSRILVVDRDWNIRSEVTTVQFEGEEQSLSSPQGVFKGSDGLLYICDTGNHRVIAIDEESKIKREILGEDLVAVSELYDFKPERVAVDSLGNVYVVSSSVYQGIMRFDQEDRFRSFFAPNEVQKTFSTWLLSLWRSIFTDEQKEELEKMLPDPYNNLFIDENDFIYTTSQAGEGRDLKKNNLMGLNVLQRGGNLNSGRFGDVELVITQGKVTGSALSDVHVDEEGIISIIDRNTNRVYQYTQECDLIAIFGGSGNEKGRFLQVSALEKQGDSYLVLDEQAGSITVFSPSAYVQNVRESLKLYNAGQYTQAEQLWEQVLLENNNMTLAYKGIGRAALQQGSFQKAMNYLNMGADDYFYSIAFREYRKEFTRNYAGVMVAGAGVIIAGLTISIRKLRRYLLSEEGEG